MVQVLPEVSSFGTQLARGIGTGLSQGLSGTADLLSESVKERMKAQAKSQSLLSTLSQLGKGQGGFDLSNLTPEQQGILATEHPEFVTAYQKGQKAQQPQKEKKERGTALLDTVESLRDKVDYVGGWAGTKTFGGPVRRETVQKRNEIDTEVADLMAYLKELDTKGQLPQGLFEKLEAKLPSSDLSEREYMGRLDAFEKSIRRHLLGEFSSEAKKSSGKNGSKDEPMVKMRAEDGTEAFVPKANVSAAMKKGAKVIR
jgi:hypothetical protein